MSDRDLAAAYLAWGYAGGWISLRDGVLHVDYEDVHETIHASRVERVSIRGWPVTFTIFHMDGQLVLPWFNKKSALEIKAALGLK